MDELGRYLREQREGRGITLEEIGRVSNISPYYLHAIEEGKYHVLPAPTFAIGFLRQYARCIGLDPEDVVLRYRLAAQSGRGSPPERPIEKLGRGRKRSVWILGGGILLLVLLWMALYPGTEITEESVREIRMPRSSLKEIKKEQLKRELGLLEDGSQRNGSPQDAAAGVEGAVEGTGGSRDAPSQAGSVEVILQAIEETWVQIRVDDEPGFEKTLKPGERYPCRAKHGVKLRIGNGSGVRIFYNGRVYENLGKKSEVVHIRFPPSGDG